MGRLHSGHCGCGNGTWPRSCKCVVFAPARRIGTLMHAVWKAWPHAADVQCCPAGVPTFMGSKQIGHVIDALSAATSFSRQASRSSFATAATCAYACANASCDAMSAPCLYACIVCGQMILSKFFLRF